MVLELYLNILKHLALKPDLNLLEHLVLKPGLNLLKDYFFFSTLLNTNAIVLKLCLNVL